MFIGANKEFGLAAGRFPQDRIEAVFAVLISHLAPPGDRTFVTWREGRAQGVAAEIESCDTLSAVLAYLRKQGVTLPEARPRFSLGQMSADADLVLIKTGKRWSLASPSGLYGAEVLGVFLGYAQRLLGVPGDAALAGVTLLDATHQRAALTRFNRTARPQPLFDPVSRLSELAALRPDDTAILDAQGVMDFAGLSAEVARLSAHLQAVTAPGEVVAVCLPRGRSSVAAFLAIWHAGLVWLPMPPSIPVPHRAAMLETAGARVVLTSREVDVTGPKVLFVEDAPDVVAARRNFDPESDAVVMFTSGTTGTPNGVRHSHRALSNRFGWWVQMYPPQPDDVYMHRTALNFIPSLTEMVSGVLSGRPLVVLSDRDATNPQAIAQAIARHRVTRLAVLPSLLRKMLEMPAEGAADLAHLRLITSAGEPCDAALVEGLQRLAPGVVLLNDYGCTETNGVLVASSRQMPKGASRLPAGRPIPNCMALVLTHAGQIAPVGFEGELCIAGMGVGLGYIGRDTLNAARFLTLDVPAELVPGKALRLFRTRDRARWLPDGQIEVLGRMDNLLKIRGIRIEAEATEAVVQALVPVAEAACGPVNSDRGAQHLACWIVWKDPAERLTDVALRAALSQHLPEAAIPTRVFSVKALPRTPNGKLARAHLVDAEPLESAAALAVQVPCTPPSSTPPSLMPPPSTPAPLDSAADITPAAYLHQITEVLASVLETDPAGLDVTRDFKLLGLDSLTVVDFVSDLSARLGREVSVGLPFDSVTPQHMAQRLANRAGPAPILAPAAPERDGRAGDIAVIGMACKMPQAPDLDAFWQLLAAGRSAVTEIPARRWNWRDHDFQNASPNRRSASRWGAFVDGEDLFDPMFFNISAREALVMAPEQRLFLETCWHGLSDAGLSNAGVAGQRIGVFAGARSSDYAERILAAGLPPNARSLLGQDNAILAARISYFLDLKGPALTLDTACSSSLVAVHQAVQSIRNGESDIALAGGVSLVTTPTQYIQNTSAGMLSPDGRCASFSNGANGFVQGEGCGVVVLKPLDRAISDGDQIYAVLKASGCNQDGRSNGITAPNGAAQRDLLARVHANSGASSAAIGMIEAHGTGTKLGDPIEFEALRDIFESAAAAKNACALGSVKTNIGHLIAAAGIAGFIKSCLSLHHRYIPASLNFDRPNEHIDLDNSPFRVPVTGATWDSDKPRRAAVSAFGFSGTNCHIVLEEAPAVAFPSEAKECKPEAPALIFLAATSQAALGQQATVLADYLARGTPGLRLGDVALTLARRLNDAPEVGALWVQDIPDLVAALRAIAGQKLGPQILFRGVRPLQARTSELGHFAQGIIASVTQGARSADLAWAEALARIFSLGEPVSLVAQHLAAGARPCYLPPVPFVQQSYWLGAKPAGPIELRIPAALCQEHRVQGKAWVPATAQMIAAWDALTIGPKVRITDWHLQTPVEVAVGQGAVLQLEVAAAGQGQRLTWRHGQATTAQASLAPGTDDSPLPGAVTPARVQALIAKMGVPVAKAAFYDQCQSAGLRYGPVFQAVRRQYRKGPQAISFLDATPEMEALADPLAQQAALFDAALHSLVGLTPKGVLAVPVRADRVAFDMPVPPRLIVIAEILEQSADHMIARLRILCVDGAVVGVIEGLRLQVLTGPAPLGPVGPGIASSDRCGLGLWRRETNQAQRDVAVPQVTEVQELATHPIEGAPRTSDHLVWQSRALSPEMLIEEFLVQARNVTQSNRPAWLIAETTGLAGGAALLAAAARAVRAERPGLHVKCLDRALGGLAQPEDFAFEGVVTEASQTWHPIDCADAGLTDPSGDICLVTGGFGGLGRKLVEWLAQHEAARLVLTSHRALTDLERAWIAELAARGTEIVVHEVDLASAEACKLLLRKIGLRFGALDRVYHAAGVTADALIANKTPEQIASVLRAKVHSIATLDAALGAAALKQMVLFSSISAVIGTPGQADYAAANAWLDAFAARRNADSDRKGQTLSVNWGLMAEGRMAPPPAELKRLRARHGMAPLPAETGFAALATLLAAKVDQAIVAYGDTDKLDRWINAQSVPPKARFVQ